MEKIFDIVCQKCSKIITLNYSTSFSMGIKLFDKKYRTPIYSIYGFVRFADEIVDTYKGENKQYLLQKFKSDTFQALKDQVSFNPVLHSFQLVVNSFKIDHELIHSFLHSMEMDLDRSEHDDLSYKTYVYGSAEVVGLMCLYVFLDGDKAKYEELRPYGKALGSAFQKINFLRDLRSDYIDRGRVYFPGIDFDKLSEQQKKSIEKEILSEFLYAKEGIDKLPKGVRAGVLSAYHYYYKLLKKIESSSVQDIKSKRLRVNDLSKAFIMLRCYLTNIIS